MPLNNPLTCPHENFHVDANVNRVCIGETGRLGAVLLHVGVSCTDCNTRFWFPGLGTGTSYTEPTTSTDGFQLSAPVVQATRRNAPDPSMVSIAIRNGDAAKGHGQ